MCMHKAVRRGGSLMQAERHNIVIGCVNLRPNHAERDAVQEKRSKTALRRQDDLQILLKTNTSTCALSELLPEAHT